jgi:hypothetical protein
MYNSDIPSRAELPSTAKLLRSTLIAIVVAAVLLVTTILPAEYGIDPTGIGRVLGLAEMGEIKTQLAKEAEEDRLRDQQGQPLPRSSLSERLFGLLIGSAYAHEEGYGHRRGAPEIELVEEPSGQTGRSDEMSLTLAPNEGAEIKLKMKKGQKATYSWTVEGGTVNYDKHGDAGGSEISYQKGRSVKEDKGVLEAGFDGSHGWFWRNRSAGKVTITLRTSGDYAEIGRVK